MRSPWKHHRPTEPNCGYEGFSIGLPRLMSLRHGGENKQKAGGAVGEDGMTGRRASVREGFLAVEEYLVRDDGVGGGGTTSRISGISVMHGFGLWMEDRGAESLPLHFFHFGDYCASKHKYPHHKLPSELLNLISFITGTMTLVGL